MKKFRLVNEMESKKLRISVGKQEILILFAKRQYLVR